MSDQWTALSALHDELVRAARSIHSEWPDVIDNWEDLLADMQIKLAKENQALKVWVLEPDSRRKVLKKIARQIASDMRDQFEYFSGNFRYSTDEVRNLLNRGALAFVAQDIVDRDGDLPQEWADTSANWDKIEAKKRVRVNYDSMDLRVHFSKLDARHRTILIRKFIADEILNGDERKELTRAVDTLTRLLNRGHRVAVDNHQGPGSRSVLSNSQAVAAIKGESG